MTTLISTFGDGDEDKVLLAMKGLAYDELVLLGAPEIEGSPGLSRLKNLEEMAGHDLAVETVNHEGAGFMQLVEGISEVLAARSGKANAPTRVILNISGGSKLLGDAALFAAFRHGIEAYHCDGNSVVRLPVLKGATAQDRFTQGQAKLVNCLSGGAQTMDEAMQAIEPTSRQSLERIVRELRKAAIVLAELKDGKVVLSLTDAGKEVAKVLKLVSKA